jgi:hypothetical protein
MNASKGTRLPPVVARLKALILSDRRKSLLLGGLTVLMLVLAVRLLMGRNMPRRALAQPAPAAADVQRNPSPSAAGSSASALPEKLVNAETRITRDIFKINAAAYPPVLTPGSSAPAHIVGNLLGDDALRAREEVARKAGRLQLQSTVSGSRPTAIINDLVVGIGDPIKERVGERLQDTGFVVTAIEEKACIVTLEGVAVRLEMKER